MPTTLPQTAVMLRPNGIWLLPRWVNPLLISVALVMIPPVLVVLVAAACFGHGRISIESIAAVLQMAGDNTII